MKIWIDILTPKQLLFSEPIIEKLRKNHDVLCTSRKYGEITKLAKIRDFSLVFVGKYGENGKESKLNASISRMKKISKIVELFSPDLTISFCSPEAARISFGLGVKHIAFCDSPHADAVMRLTLPLIQKLLIPSIIPKNKFTVYGIKKKDIIQYNAIDASVTINRKIKENGKLPFKNNKRKNILVRVEEENASYLLKSKKMIRIIEKIVDEFSEENIVILGRYTKQIKNIQKLINKKAKVVKMSYDGKYLLNHTDIFIGSGGTMTAESALIGIPTISYNAVPNLIEDFLVKKKIVKRETNPNKISKHIKNILKSSYDVNHENSRKIIEKMEDPIEKLIMIIKE